MGRRKERRIGRRDNVEVSRDRRKKVQESELKDYKTGWENEEESEEVKKMHME